METRCWILLLLILGCSTQDCLGQANPELEKLITSLNERQKSRSDFFEKYGQDFQKTVAQLSDKQEILMRVDETLTERLGDGRASIHDTTTGDRFISLRFDDAAVDEVESEISETCLDHIRMTYQDTIDGEYYARRMEAAAGEVPEDGEFTGQGKGPGNLWLCYSTTKGMQNETLGIPPFGGKYCYADIPYTGIGWGECWPNTCTEDEINTFNYYVWLLMYELPMPYYYDCQETVPWSAADIGFTTALAFFAFMVLCGTFYDVSIKSCVLDKMRGKVQKVAVQETAENLYESADHIRSDIVTSSIDGEVVNENGKDVKKTASEFVDGEVGANGIKVPAVHTEYEQQGAKVNGGFEADEHHPEHGHSEIFTVETQDTKKQAPKGTLGWAVLHATMMSFSAIENGRSVLKAKKTKNMVAVLNGLRVLSMWWIILYHTWYFYIGRELNSYQALTYFDGLGFVAVSNATLGVDTFFVLSGFLVTYNALKQMNSKRLGSIGSWLMFYFHRWWRLTPVYMAAMGIWALLVPHFGHGFFTGYVLDYVKDFCRNQWWTHPLYINNLYPWPNVLDYSCMGWTWYLAVDMQFFIISPVILIILYKNGKAGTALIISIMLVSLGSLFGLNWYYGYTINGGKRYNDHEPDPANADITYTKPYTRIPPYLAGMLLGYAIYKLKGKKIKMYWPMVLTGWVVALGTLWAVIYGVYFPYGDPTPQAVSVIYLTFHRLAFGIGVCWIIFATIHGYGGPIGVFLSWEFWIPMGRLNYCAYLLHPVIIYSKIFTDQVLFQTTSVTIAYLYVGNLVFSYLAAFVLTLVVEVPTLGIEKVIFGKFKRT